MPLDVLGRTRATLINVDCVPTLISVWGIVNIDRDGDRCLQFFFFNEEFLVNTGHQLVLNTSLPFVHTARRYYRLSGLVSFMN